MRRLARQYPLSCGVSLLLLFTAAACSQAGDNASAPSPAEVYAAVKAAAFEVLVEDHLDGSGWFASDDGLAFTAAHVLGSPGRRVEIRSSSVGRRAAEVLAVDLGHDLALLQVEKREEAYPWLPFADSAPKVGETVFVFGAPIFRHAVMQPGMVAKDETDFNYYTNAYIETLHVAADVQGGVSGGPWFNAKGEIVGLQSGTMSTNGVPAGLAFAIPLDALKSLFETKKNAATPSLGMALEEVWQQDDATRKRFPPKTEALLVKILQEDHPAARAGIKQFDAITAVDGKPVPVTDEFLRYVREKKPGEAVKLTILAPDGAGSREAVLTLGCLEVAWP